MSFSSPSLRRQQIIRVWQQNVKQTALAENDVIQISNQRHCWWMTVDPVTTGAIVLVLGLGYPQFTTKNALLNTTRGSGLKQERLLAIQTVGQPGLSCSANADFTFVGFCLSKPYSPKLDTGIGWYFLHFKYFSVVFFFSMKSPVIFLPTPNLT